jgi:acetoacetate decarboxylase
MPLRGYTIPRSPEGRSSLVPYPPWHYVGDFLVIDFHADAETAASLLPEAHTRS